MLLGALSLCVLGTFDDKWDIRASVKFAFQILLAHFAFQNGFHIDSFYGIFGVSQIPTFVQYFLSIIIIVGVVNAFNLMDGIDGLAGGIGVVSLVILIYLCVVVDAKILMLLYVILLSALLGFLRFNLSKCRKIFMGDAGSLAIGFIIILSGLDLLKKAAPIQETSTVLVGIFAVLTLPVFDALRVFKQRIQSGKSPFSADKTHLHHMMLQLGFNHKSSAFLIVALSSLLVFIGFVTSSFYSITIGIVFILTLFYSVSRYLYLKSQLLGWRDRIRKMESDYGL
jgi:UDP-GlcNAc:undecaprenyl-phosphate GlcNAc-1-phosphate transferase